MSQAAYETPVKKIVVVGDGQVGKTSLLMRYKDNQFSTDYLPTIFENYEVNAMIDGQSVVLSLEDTAGQEGYDKLRLLAYPHTDVFIVCFSVGFPNSLANVSFKWIPELKEHSDSLSIVLVGTKCDLRDDVDMQGELMARGERLVTKKEASKVADTIGAYKYIECSALEGTNVQQVFEEATRLSLEAKEVWQKGKLCCSIL